MAKGFFATSTITGTVPMSSLAKCGLCGLHKQAKHTKLPVTGKGEKKILLVCEFPERENRKGRQWTSEADVLLRYHLKKAGVNAKRDCWKINALACRPKRRSQINEDMVDACRPTVFAAIKKLQPNVIILLGKVAMDSVLKHLWRNKIGKADKWRGNLIPVQELNSWVVASWSPAQIANDFEGTLTEKFFFRHLCEAVGASGSPPWSIVPDYKEKVEIIHRPARAARMLKRFRVKKGTIAFDYEGNCLVPEGDGPKIVSCSVCWKGKRTISFPWEGEAIEQMSRLLKSGCKKIATNMKFEDRWTNAILGHGVRNWFFDTMIAAHLIDNTPGITGLKHQAFVQLGVAPYNEHIQPYLEQHNGRFNRIEEIDSEDLLLYGGMDSHCTWGVALKQIQILKGRS